MGYLRLVKAGAIGDGTTLSRCPKWGVFFKYTVAAAYFYLSYLVVKSMLCVTLMVISVVGGGRET